MIELSDMSATTVRFSGHPALFAHWETGLFGSASRTVTPTPLRANSVARMTAEVDFPAPPLGLAKTIVGMMNKSEERVAGKASRYPNPNGPLSGSPREAVCIRKAIRQLSAFRLVAGGYQLPVWFLLESLQSSA